MVESNHVYQRIAVADISEPGHQLRAQIDPERLGELADSMAAEGLHQPIGLRGPNAQGQYEIIWGHRRFLAARLLLWAAIPARIFPPSYDPLLAAISENLQRVDLDPVEEARAVHKLLHQGRAIVEIARLFRRSQAWVSSRLEVLGFHADLIDAIQTRGLKLTVAQALQDVDNCDYRADLIHEALRTGATGTTAQVWRQHYLADRERIISNHLVVDEIRSRRESWIIYATCEGCHKQVDYRETESWRFCLRCSDELRTAQQTNTGTDTDSSTDCSTTADSHLPVSHPTTAREHATTP